jgi:hypothetical protein|tara:strand:+ start:413 stop:802 length:390 start_codon:yes stop_codon:yes gene_type:complete
MKKLTEETFLLYAAKHYDNPQLQSEEEFYDDLKKFKYIKRLFNKYAETGKLKERLILNHIVVLSNVFGPEAAVKMLFLRLPEYLHYLKPFLIMLSVLPERIEVGDKVYLSSDINIDETIVKRLRDIRNG